MILIIFFAVLAILILWIKCWEDGAFDFDDIMLLIITSMPIAIVGGGVGLFIALALPAEREFNHWNQNLVTIQDGSSISGSFFLGCGQIDGSMKYTYYTESNDGYFRMHQKDYKRAAIQYCDCTPHVEYIDHEYTDWWFNWFAVDLKECQQTIFHVPKGTIKSQYHLDAQ